MLDLILFMFGLVLGVVIFYPPLAWLFSRLEQWEDRRKHGKN